MGLCQVDDMNVVANTTAIGRRVIRSVDLNRLLLA